MRDSEREKPIVLSLEQALSLPYATLRFVHLGWRVIRLEATPRKGSPKPGDPNRYIGREIAGKDRHAYYIAPNVGKEAIALNLKDERGRELLTSLVRELPVSVFCTNLLPKRHKALGIDYETLSSAKKDLIWGSISALGCDLPSVPGYDPTMQAQCGFMDITGQADGPPLQCGPPITDLKAGDELYAQTLHALWQKSRHGRGQKIDVSMGRCAASWLLTFLPLLEMGSPPSELKRHGNEHRQFFPVNAYPTRDGYVFLALGSDAQWKRLVGEPAFRELDRERFASNELRRVNRNELHEGLRAVTLRKSTGEVSALLARALVPHAPITPIEKVMDLPFVSSASLQTQVPGGERVRLPPAAVSTDHLEACQGRLPFPPRYGEHTLDLFREIGISDSRLTDLRGAGVVFSP